MESFSFAKAIGVGVVDSAINLTATLKSLENLPKEIVFIGSGGLYRGGEILEIYTSSLASNLEISHLLNLAYTPIFDEISVNVSYETLGRNSVKTNSSNFITTDSNLAYKFADLGYFIENMELYSVLKVANFFKIPAYGILCATNFCDEFAHKNFIKNYEKAKIKLENFLKDRRII